MSETIQPGLLRRFHDTPWRDLLRGRLSGRLNWSARIESADLSAPAKGLVRRVVKRSRLWRLEKADVADELLAHFADGLAAGIGVEQLVERFGDEKRAAKLIRRAKMRNRPLAWRATAVVVRCIELTLALYLFLAAYFLAGKPSPQVDYIQVLNQPILQIPVEQRAWPLYRQAILETADYEPPKQYINSRPDALAPGRPGWPWMSDWLHHHAAALELIRQGARRPAFGFIFGAKGSADDPAVFPNQHYPLVDRYLRGISHIYLNNFRQLANFLWIDAQLARQEKDRARLLGNIFALLNMSDQLRGDGFLISGFVSVGLRSMAMEEIESTLTDQPQLLTDSDLQSFAHSLSRFGDATEMFNVKSERLIFYDDLQHAYTDNGSGSGRFTAEGIQIFSGRYNFFGVFDFSTTDEPGWRVLGPLFMAIAPSRSQLLQKYDGWMDAADADGHRTMHDLPVGVAERQRQAILDSFPDSIRYCLIRDRLWWTGRTREQAEYYLGWRDGIVTGLALEMYHRQHGEYPRTLAQLVPALLPSVPVDRINGEPVRYVLRQGRPIIYSVGADGRDDGGRVPLRNGFPDAFAATKWGDSAEDAPSGDWILYPQAKIGN